MPEVIVAANVEALLVGYLRAELATRNLADVKVATRLPLETPRPESFVRVLLVGGSSTSLVTRIPRLVIDTYGVSETATQPLAALVLGLLLAVDQIDGVQFYHPAGSGVASDLSNFPDPSITDRVRYTATVAVGIRAHAA